jgi:glycosyltransferase involved in cell wall biosynthesis
MGGTERMSVNIAGVMNEEGWESHLVVSRSGGGLEAHIPEGVQVHFLNKSAFYDLGAFWRLVRLNSKYRPTILHAHSTSIYWAVLLKILFGKFRLVWHDHFGLSDQLDLYPRKEFVILSKWINRIVVVNEKLESYWKSLLPYRAKDIQYIGNFPWLKLRPAEKSAVFTFLNLANFRPQKDQLNLLKACKILSDQNFDFEILLVGEWVDPEWVEKVKKSIAFLNLQEKVKLVGPKSDVTDYLENSHVGVLSSESEGLPVALLEYGLAGLPVICTDVGDCSKVISGGEFGFLVPPGNSELLALAMKECMSNFSNAEKFGENLKKKVELEYGKESFLDSYWKLNRIS